MNAMFTNVNVIITHCFHTALYIVVGTSHNGHRRPSHCCHIHEENKKIIH